MPRDVLQDIFGGTVEVDKTYGGVKEKQKNHS